MILLLIRHGQTLFNQLGYTQGVFDSQLTDLGIRQAKEACKMIQNEQIDYAFSSYSERAYDTVEITLGNRNISVIRDKRIKEMNFGVFEGNCDSLFHSMIRSMPGEMRMNFKKFDGEDASQVIEREMNFLEELNNKYPDSTILVGGHGISLMLLIQHIAKESMHQYDENYYMPGNADIVKIEYHGTESKVLNIYRNELR